MSRTQAVDPSVSRTPIELDATNKPTICVLCSHNCGMRVDVQDGKITAVRADESNPITKGYVCNKGFSIEKYVSHENRVEHPLKRQPDGSFARIGWDQAISEIAAKLTEIRDQHAPRAIGLVGIGGQGNHMDAAYGLGFLRSVGSKRWFNAFAQEKTQHALVSQWMFNASPATFMHPDTEHTNFMLVMGTNPKISNRGHNATDTFKELQKREDCTVVVADPRQTETTQTADRHLRVRPGTDAYMLLGIAATIVSRELVDYEFVQNSTVQYEELREVLSQVDVDEMAKRCGVEVGALVDVATELAKAEHASIFYDLGVEQTPFSTLVSYAIHMILSITGNVGCKGGNVFMETFAPAQLDEDRVSAPEVALASGIEAIRALGNMGMFSPTLVPEEIMLDHPERIRGLIVEGSNPILSFSDANAWREARKQLEILVVIDPAMTDTARLADYVLPTPVGYEKWEIALFPKLYPQIHTQLRPPVVPGPAEALPEPEIYARLAEAMDLFGPVPAELEELGAKALEPEGAMMFLGTAQQLATEAGGGENHMLFWAYWTLGKHLPAPALVGIWFQCHMNALQRGEDVLRTLGDEWKDKDPFQIAAELFKRILDHPEGVEIACMDPDKNYEQHVNWDDKRVRLAPEKMLSEMRRAMETPAAHDPEYPFVLGSGLRTRWTANTIQQDPSWRKGRGPHCTLNLSESDAEKIGVKTGDQVKISTRRGEITLPAQVDRKMQDGHVSMPNGFGGAYKGGTNGDVIRDGANMNEITDVADRDPFTGCPHHRYVQVKLERFEA